MKRILLLIAVAMISGCSSRPSAEDLVNKETRGQITNGYEVGKCYDWRNENPFEPSVLMLITDCKSGYCQYRWWADDLKKYLEPRSKKMEHRGHSKEVKCP